MRTEPAPLHPTLATLSGCPAAPHGWCLSPACPGSQVLARCTHGPSHQPVQGEQDVMGSGPRRRWLEQWASRDATLVAHGISESLPCTDDPPEA